MQIPESILQQMVGCTVRIADGSIYHDNWVKIEAIVDADSVRVQADNWIGLCRIAHFLEPMGVFGRFYYAQQITDIIATHDIQYHDNDYEYRLYLNETEHQLLKRRKKDADN